MKDLFKGVHRETATEIVVNECYRTSVDEYEFRFASIENEEDKTALSDLTPSDWVIFRAWEEDGCPENHPEEYYALEVNTCHIVGSHAYITDGTSYSSYDEDNCDGTPEYTTDDITTCFGQNSDGSFLKVVETDLDYPVTEEL